MFCSRTVWGMGRLVAVQTVNEFRNFCTSPAMCKTVPKNLQGKNRSAQDWLYRQLNDPFVKRSRYDNYRARSAYKLIEIDDKYSILKPGMIVVECGAAPGSWTQVAVQRVNADGKKTDSAGKARRGTVVGIDLIPFEPVPHAICLPEMNILTEECSARLTSVLAELNSTEDSSSKEGRLADAVLSDMAPSTTGHKDLDHDNVITLCYAALKFAVYNLSPGGTFLCKVLDGARTRSLYDDLANLFETVRYVKPQASRDDSTELYLLAMNYRGIKGQRKAGPVVGSNGSADSAV